MGLAPGTGRSESTVLGEENGASVGLSIRLVSKNQWKVLQLTGDIRLRPITRFKRCSHYSIRNHSKLTGYFPIVRKT